MATAGMKRIRGALNLEEEIKIYKYSISMYLVNVAPVSQEVSSVVEHGRNNDSVELKKVRKVADFALKKNFRIIWVNPHQTSVLILLLLLGILQHCLDPRMCQRRPLGAQDVRPEVGQGGEQPGFQVR